MRPFPWPCTALAAALMKSRLPGRGGCVAVGGGAAQIDDATLSDLPTCCLLRHAGRSDSGCIISSTAAASSTTTRSHIAAASTHEQVLAGSSSTSGKGGLSWVQNSAFRLVCLARGLGRAHRRLCALPQQQQRQRQPPRRGRPPPRRWPARPPRRRASRFKVGPQGKAGFLVLQQCLFLFWRRTARKGGERLSSLRPKALFVFLNSALRLLLKQCLAVLKQCLSGWFE